MKIWSTEIKELEKLYESLKDKFPELYKELVHLIATEDENVALLYSRRCLEVIITDLCECELKRSRGTEPLKGIIDKLHKEEKVPSNIIASMHGLNTLSTFGTHPKEFDPQQVRPVLINLAIIINWYLNYHDIKSPEIRERTGKKITTVEKKHNLPVSTTSFIGREKEMKEVRDLFQKSRLVTLTGAGGCGKTRLAREIALMLVEEYKDGVWFIDLSSISDPNYITKGIANVLNIKEEPGKPVIDSLIEKISDRSLLLLLDNCEHLVQAAAEVADKLLHSVSGIRILATSREALNIPGEVVWRIPSLSFPDPGSKKDINEVQQYEAIKLFTDRAGLSKPGFAINAQNVSAITGICQRIEGIPLAIELAATRIRHLGPETIFERLNDQFRILSSSGRTAPERQQTLKATIDWSYNLLSEQEKLLFNRLSVFAADFSLETVEEVCSDEKLEKANIITIIFHLVDKSLIIAENEEDGSIRYRYLEPIRQYSLNKLIDSKEEYKSRKKHLEYYIRMAEKAYDEQYDAMAFWTGRLAQEHDNLISALEWADQHSPDEYRLLTGSLAWFWRINADIISGIKHIEKALTIKKDRSQVTARLLSGLGEITLYMSGLSKGFDSLYECLEIWRELGNSKEQAIILRDLGLQEYSKGSYDAGLKYNKESLKLARETGNPGLINYCMTYVCLGHICLNNIEEARLMAEQLLESSKELNQTTGILSGYHFLGDSYLISGNFKKAEIYYAEGMKTSFQSAEMFMALQDMRGVAMSVAGQSRYAKTIRLNAASLEEAKRLGIVLPDPGIKFWGDLLRKYIYETKEILPKKQVYQYDEEGKNMDFEAAIEYALDFDKD